MSRRAAFHLDCHPIIPACRLTCSKCIGEMGSVFGGTPGVSKFYREGSVVVVEQDASVVTVEQLMDIFRGCRRSMPTILFRR